MTVIMIERHAHAAFVFDFNKCDFQEGVPKIK